jgi:hypothetical protein
MIGVSPRSTPRGIRALDNEAYASTRQRSGHCLEATYRKGRRSLCGLMRALACCRPSCFSTEIRTSSGR